MGVTATPLEKRQLSGGLIKECSPGKIALTFDDGPSSETTGQLLDDLLEADVKVTLFVIGQNVEENPDLLRRAYDEGHHIASHTYSHLNLNSLSAEEIEEEADKAAEAIENVIGVKPQYIRCPYGSCDERVQSILNNMGYKIIDWNLDTLDWQTLNTELMEKVYENTLSIHSPETTGFISLQHDIHPSTVQAIPNVLDTIDKYNFSVTTVPDCFGDEELYF
ncbi:glycoside hydrolase/deacetylase [Basidiobolus meristosporus CBS 931.73]|uniref:Glycoside hydrolase/deacetylase n=1 Tax=Basidiobolus meristosporus CBS 931.73 TaxID=1314790 RepID=A0A1Y1YE19_9FUNG|nr:glycoside hydrolase/deacetylase [Basidiobolus meristosporus CBS 931.73]|eukprot:ORX96270.1 glycoside hydrolase/deacetylase [Basidiobolus meristosporus CBS 931.73]